jgi:hypothetical protein
MLDAKLESFIEKMLDPKESEAYRYAELLAKENNSEVLQRMITILQSDNPEHQFLAAKSIALTDDNAIALDSLLEEISDKRNKAIQGDLAEALEGFDCSDKFHQLFKLSLFGSIKTIAMAQEILDFEEFDITARAIRKAEKHWVNFSNNVKQDDAFELKKQEVEEWFEELKSFVD